MCFYFCFCCFSRLCQLLLLLLELEVFAHYEQLLHSAEAQILRAADVVCCTCIEAATPRLQQAITVSLCVVDESDGVSEPEVLLPLSRAKHALLLARGGGQGEGGAEGEGRASFFERHAQHVHQLHGQYGPK